MKTKLLSDRAGQKVFLAVLGIGDEVMESLQRVAEQESFSAAHVTALGAFEKAELYFYDWSSKDYVSIPVNEATEVATLVGDITQDANGKPSLHLHAVLGKRDGSAVAGHLKSGKVRPTLEVIITETPAHLRRLKDDETGLALIRLDSA